MSEDRPQQGSGAGPDGDKAAPSIFQLASNLAAISAILLTGFAVIKAYAVAHFSLTTGAALLTASPLTVLLGSIMSYAYWILPLASLASLWLGFRLWQDYGWSGQATALLGVALFTGLLAPVGPLLWSTVAFVGYIAIFHAPAAMAKRRAKNGPLEWAWLRPWARLTQIKLFSIHLFFVVAAIWVLFASLTRPWTPIEIIKFRDAQGQQLIVGNLLPGEGDWTTVLRANDRGLSRIKSDDILTRQLCHLTGAQSPGQAPLLWVLTRHPYRSPNRECRQLAHEEPGVPLVDGSLPSRPA